MSAHVGSPENPLRVAIVGSGPSGFYAAEALLKAPLAVRVSMFERLPVPFGLVRFGVAPDHPKLKQPTVIFDRIAHSAGFEFFGNVAVGRDLGVEELQSTHHAVVFACGAQADRPLGVPGEDKAGSYGAAEFVGWYNGHPDYRDCKFDLSVDVAVILGQGNVAADIARMLAQPVDRLRGTDIAAHALEALASSRIRVIHIVGRRSPAQAKFTPRELQDLAELPGCALEIAPPGLSLSPNCLSELADPNNVAAARNVALWHACQNPARSQGDKRIVFHFLKRPLELTGSDRVERIVLERSALRGPPFAQTAVGTGEQESLECGLVVRSIGYRARAIVGVPFDQARGVIPNVDGRVTGRPGLYVTGWIKRGPSGLIGTNRADSVATVSALLADFSGLALSAKAGPGNLIARLSGRGARVVNYEDWLRIDRHELEQGRQTGKTREKLVSLPQMLAVVQAS